MPTRRRPVQEFEATQSEAGPRTVTLDSLIGGYNGYTSPDLLSPQFWAGASNIYAGQFGTIRRARWAPFINSSIGGHFFNSKLNLSLFSYLDTQIATPAENLIFVDSNDPTNAINPRYFVSNPANVLNVGQDFPSFFSNKNTNVFLLAKTLLIGPYQRVRIGALILEANNLFRSKVFNTSVNLQPFSTSYPSIAFWGIDAPDASPQITLAAGTTATIAAAPTGASRSQNVATITTTAPHGLSTGQFVGISGVTDTSFNTAAGTAVQITVTGASTFTYPNVGPTATSGSGTVTFGITQTVGRSYQYALENSLTGHVSAPSPATQYVKYASQTGTIDCIEVGTVAYNAASAIVTGTGTSFTQAMVGKQIEAEGLAFVGSQFGLIVSVQSSTQLTLAFNANTTGTAKRFWIFDPQATHVRLYATGDGGSVYFLIGRNQISGNVLATSGFEFSDTANSQPPNPPFSSELTQIYNVPPPLGQFVQDYQGRALVYGVTASPATFFYTNVEATVVGQGPESSAPLNTVTMPLGDGALNGSANLPTGLLLWSNRQDMFKLTGLLTDNTVANAQQLGATIQRLPYKIGCGSAYATAVTPLGAMWLSSDREVWLFTDHYAPKNVGKPVQDVLSRINGARLAFAKMTYYKRGDRSWLALAVALDSSTFNNKLLLLDLDLLASNGQPSFFTFDMATNQPTWYQFDVNCESICTSYDANSINHLMVGDVDLITDVDWQPGYYTIATEQNVAGSNKLHAFGNEDPHMVKTFQWMRALTNQIPANLAAQGWGFSVDAFDDDAFVIGVNANTTLLVPGTDSPATTRGLEFSPALFKFGGVKPIKGRRFQIGTTFPSTPGLWELRGFEVSYENIVGI